jgi:hypothetical protein
MAASLVQSGGGWQRLYLRTTLFDHLIRASEQFRRNIDAKSLGGVEVDDQIKFGRLLKRQIGGRNAVKDFRQQSGHALERFFRIT